MFNKIVLGFGSNVGNRLKNLKAGIKEISLTHGIDFLALSSIYETEPWGFTAQRDYLNCTGVFLCRLTPGELIRTVKKAEKKLGRLKRGKWRPREIDIDILFYGSDIYKSKKLVIPHPHLHERNFVLKPLAEIMPRFIHPLMRRDIEYICRHSGDRMKVSLFKKN
jgi:2-amino-4-hydroxy-6-hydroxymethyldihydropteridine diphosphokinase